MTIEAGAGSYKFNPREPQGPATPGGGSLDVSAGQDAGIPAPLGSTKPESKSVLWSATRPSAIPAELEQATPETEHPLVGSPVQELFKTSVRHTADILRDPTQPDPGYQPTTLQIFEALREGKLQEGVKYSTNLLATRFNITESVSRRAVDELRAEGIAHLAIKSQHLKATGYTFSDFTESLQATEDVPEDVISDPELANLRDEIRAGANPRLSSAKKLNRIGALNRIKRLAKENLGDNPDTADTKDAFSLRVAGRTYDRFVRALGDGEIDPSETYSTRQLIALTGLSESEIANGMRHLKIAGLVTSTESTTDPTRKVGFVFHPRNTAAEKMVGTVEETGLSEGGYVVTRTFNAKDSHGSSPESKGEQIYAEQAQNTEMPRELKTELLRREYYRQGGKVLISDVQMQPDGRLVFYESRICMVTPDEYPKAAAKVLWYLQDEDTKK